MLVAPNLHGPRAINPDSAHAAFNLRYRNNDVIADYDLFAFGTSQNKQVKSPLFP